MNFSNPFQDSSVPNFNGLSVSFSYFAQVPNVALVNGTETKMLAKALLKKDVKTKLKSLKKLIQIYDEKDGSNDHDFSFVQFYAQILPKLLVLNDKSVRISAYWLCSKLISYHGKKISVYLKNFVPFWLLGVFEGEKLVVIEVEKSISQCFNGKKSSDDLIFIFQNETLEVIKYFLTQESVDTIMDQDDAKLVKEELTLPYTRILTSMLNLLCRMGTSAKDLSQEYADIIMDEKLWGLLVENNEDYNYVSVKKSLLNLFVRVKLSSVNSEFKIKFPESQIFKNLYKYIKSGPSHKTAYFATLELLLLSLINLPLSKFLSKPSDLSKFRKQFVGTLSSSSYSPNFFTYLEILYEKNIDLIDWKNDFDELIVKPTRNLKIRSNPSAFLKFVDKFYTRFYNEKNASLQFLEFVMLEITSMNIGIVDTLSKLSKNDCEELLISTAQKVKEDDIKKFLKILQALKVSENDKILSSLQLDEIVVLKSLIELGFTDSCFVKERIQTLLSQPISSTNFEKDGELLIYLDKYKYSEYKELLTSKICEILSLQNEKWTMKFLTDFANNLDIKHESITKFIEEHDGPNSFKLLYKFCDLTTIFDSASKLTHEELLQLLKYLDSKSLSKAMDTLDLRSFMQYIWDLNPEKIAFLKQMESVFDNVSVKQLYCYSLARKLNEIFVKNKSDQYLLDYFANKDLSDFLDIFHNDYDKCLRSPSDAIYILGVGDDCVFLVGDSDAQPEKPELSIEQLAILNQFILKLGNQTIGECLGDMWLDYWYYTSYQNMDTLESVTLESKMLISAELLANNVNNNNAIHTVEDIRNFKAGENLSFAKFYNCKQLQASLANSNEFESEGFFKLLQELIKTRDYFKLLSILPIIAKSLNDREYQNLIKTLISEVLVIKNINDSNLESALGVMTVLNSILGREESDLESKLPKIQLNMMMRNFLNWVQSDLSYEVEFIPLRIQLVKFYTLMVTHEIKNFDVDYLINEFYKESLEIVNSCIGNLYEEENVDALLKEVNFNLVLFYNLLVLFKISDEKRELYEISKEFFDEVYETMYSIIVGVCSSQLILSKFCNQGLKTILNYFRKSVGFQDYLKFLKNDVTELLGKSDSALNLVEIDVTKFKFGMFDALMKKERAQFKLDFALNYKEILENETYLQIPKELIANIENKPLEYLEVESLNNMHTYLLSWHEILEYFYEGIPQVLMKKYLENNNLEHKITELLEFIFNQLDLTRDALFKEDETKLEEKIFGYHIFGCKQNTELATEVKILMVHLYYMVICKFKVQVQQWFNNIRNKQEKSEIEKFTSKFISEKIINDEFDILTKEMKDLDVNNENHTVKLNRATNEIKSQYLIDEQSSELIFRLPKSYPLTHISVVAPQRIGVKEQVWKSWVLACQIGVNNGYGTKQGKNSIFAAIEAFDKNINLHFKGFEECAICYSILHIQDKSLPTKSCGTCHNKFHGGCLLKWFKSSGNNTCPLCRSEFNFRTGS